ncbi:3-oxoacyl-ACP synthase III family protein, partial [uncultured Parabacteroides sp.]|uniref:3-oxoacyl-ACP synthase III family protein n=1 Tax=uncultured Parabacteroides sp. TaxID=512312 RepID=UPI00272C90B0
FNIKKAKALYLSSACSSFLNALEVVEGYFAMGKATKALILSADKNSAYYNETDPKAGHLWGDAAAAFFISKERVSEKDPEIVEVYTQGLGSLGKAPVAVNLRPRDGGIMMPEGRDVFIQACTYMPKNVLYLLEKNGYTLDNLTYFIGHQANMRIMSNIAKQLNLPEEKFLHNIEELGNTGSVSSALVYAQNDHNFKEGDLVAITVFGGGYSTGACLIKC